MSGMQEIYEAVADRLEPDDELIEKMFNRDLSIEDVERIGGTLATYNSGVFKRIEGGLKHG